MVSVTTRRRKSAFDTCAGWLQVSVLLGLLLALPQPASSQNPGEAGTPTPQLQEATRLSKQVEKLRNSGQYAEALPLAQQVLTIRESELGPTHLEVAASVSDVAVLYWRQGKYTEAEPLFRRALTVREKALGPEHPEVAKSLNNLAILYSNQGKYAEAEPLFRRALAIREKALGPEHPEVARSLYNLASLQSDQGKRVQAEPLITRALTISEKALGAQHPSVATGANHLAELYRYQGRYAQAEPLFKRALEINQSVLGPEHPDVTFNLNGLADLYRDWGKYDQAEPLYRRALGIAEKNLGPEHPRTAQSLDDLAVLYLYTGRPEQAQPLFERALASREKVLGPEHPDFAESLNGLATLQSNQGRFSQAEATYRRALAVREKTFGPWHPLVGEVFDGLAVLYARQGKADLALSPLTRSLDIQEHNLAFALGSGSEQQKRDYLATLTDTADVAIWLHQRVVPANRAAGRLAFTTVLRRKGRLLDALNEASTALRQRLGPEDQKLLDALTDTRSELATLVFRGLGDSTPEQYRAKVTGLENRAEQLESALGRSSAGPIRRSVPATLDGVSKRLPQNTALVELVQYRPFNPGAQERVARFGPTRYAAYLLDRNGLLQSVDLGDAVALDEAIAPVRKSLRDESGSVETFKTEARKLDRRLMAPIRSKLGKTRQLLISPDGALNLLPFAALVDERSRFLVENYAISYLGSGRDLLRLDRRGPAPGAPLVVANPNFDNAVFVAQGTPADTRRGGEIPTDLGQLRYDPLPATAEEARAIARLLPAARVLTGKAATEDALKQAKSPSILHIATHGFFLEAAPQSAQNPLLRSGLALAGFNKRTSGDGDGALTALEISGLDLRSTRLVVLSACETGLGEVASGEGVYGLKRALTLAGAESQLLSLWQVADEATRDLMVQYYRQLQQQAGRSEGLRRAQLALLRNREYSHPYYWSAFVLSGDWRAMGNRSGG